MKKILLLILALSFSHQVIACEFEDVTFDSDFSVARLDGCEKISDDRFRLTIEAENYPINHSPWYAFKVTSKKPSKIRVEMIFKKDKPRYYPKVSRDGQSWSAIRFKVKKNKLTYFLHVNEKPLWVAGQEIINNQFYISWLKSVESLGKDKLSILGNSTQDRPIYQLQSTSPNNNEWLVLTGRMHPPEVTGALALFPFSQEVLLGDGIAKLFRERFNILLIPNLNPDGVEHGNWRHNINGVDLNRDWKNFKQKETQIVHNKLQQITKAGGKIVYAIDFHSTGKDIFYSMPADYGLHPANLTNDWLASLEKKMPDFTVRIKAGNNPGKGVFKQYIADTYGVHAITYEMGDHTDRKVINEVAKVAAKSFMQHLLDTPKSKFKK